VGLLTTFALWRGVEGCASAAVAVRWRVLQAGQLWRPCFAAGRKARCFGRLNAGLSQYQTFRTCAWMPCRLRSFFSSSLSPLAASLLVVRITCGGRHGTFEADLAPIVLGSLLAGGAQHLRISKRQG